MEKTVLKNLLTSLIATWENEVVEFKNVGDSFPTHDIGKYFSALSNEANLRGRERGWLIFGVDNKTRAIVGSDYRPERARLDGLKHQISQNLSPSIAFREIHELQDPQGRVILFEIPATPRGMPVDWKGHYYARAGESLIHLGLDKSDEIRNQPKGLDWTASLVEAAKPDHLDPAAVAKAREAFASKYANRFQRDEVMEWSDAAFLDRAKITIDGEITRAAVLLPGKRESAHLLSLHPAQTLSQPVSRSGYGGA